MENQPIARLTFTCNRNWEEMVPVAGGRFCNDCQKKVVDFTDKTNDEISAYLIESTTQVCGRFQRSQLVPAAAKPVWKRWLSAAAMFAAVFMGIKEASAQALKELPPAKEIKIVELSDFKPDNSVTECWNINRNPKFPGGDTAFINYLKAKLPKAIMDGFSFSFIIKRDGSPDGIIFFGSSNAKAKARLTKRIKNSPKWIPGFENGAVYYPVMHFHINR